MPQQGVKTEPKRKDTTQRRPQRRSDEDTTDAGRDEFDEWMTQKTVLKPDDQLQLTEAEMKEEFTRILNANNPHAPQNIVRYSFKERQYKPIPQVEQLAVHYLLEGSLLHKDSDEARRQLARQGAAPVEVKEVVAEVRQEEPEKEAEEGEVQAPKVSKGPEKKLTNQFNFCDRASQTYNNPLRERGNVTEPPPRANYSANITQWSICDEYAEDFEKQQQSKEKKPGGVPQKHDSKSRKKANVAESQMDDLGRISQPLKIIERMVNQNTFDEIAQDFKYFEDLSDEYRDQQGTLLPLWKFTHEKARKLAATAICWSTKYHDLLAVGYGSYDFLKPLPGMICFYTLKNPSYPEYVYETESGVLCLDLHSQYLHMLCAGFYDGSVAVYNIGGAHRKPGPIYMSSAKTGKHTDPVWEVRWQKDDLDGNLNFNSISADGRITSWTLVKNDLVVHDIILLRALEQDIKEGPDGSRLVSMGSGTTFDFHKQLDHLFLVGTEDGRVLKCSKAYSSEFLSTIKAHHMAVYRVSWNVYHPDIFLTCSADWTVKIWDHKKTDPVFVFDLGSPVGDVAWAPFSSTVFAAVTADGKVHVFDLSINKYEPICEQLVAQKKKTRLTHLSFNPTFPILVIGGDRGPVTSFKLSPNLRKLPKDKKGSDLPKGPEVEIQKLDRILTLVA